MSNEELYFLPRTGFVRLPVVLAHVGIKKSVWYAGVNAGIYPGSHKLSPGGGGRAVGWRAEDIHSLIQQLGGVE